MNGPWLSMDQAPKDRRILVDDPDYGVLVASWFKDGRYSMPAFWGADPLIADEPDMLRPRGWMELPAPAIL